MFSPTEFLMLLAIGVAVGLLILRRLRPQMQQAIANSPPQAFRTPSQRRLHWASLLCLLPPFAYIFAIDGTHFFPVFVALTAHAAIMQALRIARFGYIFRLWIVPFASVVAVVVGVVISAWPDLNSQSFRQAPWLLLAIASGLVGVSTVLSILSFPLGFGERAR